MKPNEIKKNRGFISDVIQGLWRDLGQIEMALIDVENIKEKDYDWLEEVTQEQKDAYINRDLDYAKKRADREIKEALMGILRKSNEIANKALEMIDEEIEY